MEFKVGDRVKLVSHSNYLEEYHGATVGSEGTIVEGFQGVAPVGEVRNVTVEWDTSTDPVLCDFSELTVVRDSPGGWTAEGIEKAAFEPQEPKVSYYQFPGGVEVRQISAHLMSFPSQIMQYASRSGRVDGNCKSEYVSDKIRDFEKIIDFARWEIERLENER